MELSAQVSTLAIDTAHIKSGFATLTKPVPVTPKSNHVPLSTPNVSPSSPEVLIVDNSLHEVQPDLSTSDDQAEHLSARDEDEQNEHDQSMTSDANTIDDNVPDDQNSLNHLNFNLPTIQLN